MRRPVHFEIHAANLDAAQGFYEAVFGWRFSSWGDASYRVITTGEEGAGINGGLVQRRGPAPESGQPLNGFVCTVEVETLDGTLDDALTRGATIALPRMPVPGLGWLAYIHDPDGNILGLLEPNPAAA